MAIKSLTNATRMESCFRMSIHLKTSKPMPFVFFVFSYFTWIYNRKPRINTGFLTERC